METKPNNTINPITKRHINQVIRFNADLVAFAKETDQNPPVLYENANTSFTLWNVRIEDGCLRYEYDGREESDQMIFEDEDTHEMFEFEGIDDIPHTISFWRHCLCRAKKYWSMDPERLDAIQNGDAEDLDEESED